MATAEELLRSVDNVLTINSDLRTINIPSSVTILGVESDDDVRRLHFSMPSTYGEFDLSAFDIRVNYLNANNQGDIYEVTDAETDKSSGVITFSWLVGRTATSHKGDVRFIICLKRSENGVVVQEFNTTVASLNVLEGLETNQAVVQENPDVIENILKRLGTLENTGGISDEQIGNAVNAYLTEHPVTGGATTEQAAQIKANKEAIEELKKNGTGTPGADGEDGKDGVSPTIKVDEISGGHRVTITDVNGAKTFDVMDGTDGQNGVGEDGVSPTIEVTAIDGGHRITITDVNGTKSFDVADGKDGTGGTGGTDVDGEDGGYYTPAVDANGNLSWSASKAGMPSVPNANIKGEPGEDGKDYVLTEADKQEIAGMVDVKVEAGGNINDVTPSATTTYSSNKIDALLNEQKEANATQDTRLTVLEQAGGIAAPYLGELKRTAIYPCSTIYLDGDTTGMTKDVSVVLDILITDEYGNEFFRGKSETSWQGSGSLSYPKKNLSLKLQDADGEKAKISVFPDYATHAYHLKANYLDYSMVRNSVGAQLAHDFDNTVFPVDAPITVKSIPVIMYLNGAFNGCYTLNYKQDDKLFGMDTEMNPLTEIVYRSGAGSWTLSNFEYRGDADETAEMQAKLKVMMDFAANSDDAAFTAEFEDHFDLNNAINYWLYADIACATDSMSNNWTVATWDGAKWYMCWYDLDIIFGLMEAANHSAHPNTPSTDILNLTYTINNPIWAKLYRCFYERIRERYWELRGDIANPTKLTSRFRTFQSKWNEEKIGKERSKWTVRPNKTADVDDMYEWMIERFAYLDEKYTLVEKIPCTGITLDQDTLTFTASGTQMLTATVTPIDTTDSVMWSSNAPDVASVSGGMVTAKANGSATITATCGEFSAICTVNVSGVESDSPNSGPVQNGSTLIIPADAPVTVTQDGTSLMID